MLIKKEDNPQENKPKYIYIDSITSKKSKDYESHIALNKIILEKVTYYICCDVNYRFAYDDKKINGYSLKIVSQRKIKVKNITEEIQKNNKGIEIFQESLIDFIEKRGCEDYKIDNNYTATYIHHFSNPEIFPFDIYYFHNIEAKPVKIKITIPNKKIGTLHCIYNDDVTSEIENSLMKELSPNQKKIITVMNYNFSSGNDKYNKNNLEI